MKIIDIFDDQRLLSFQYEGEQDNEFDRLIDFWTDTGRIHEYAKKNGVIGALNLIRFVIRINDSAEFIEDWLSEIEKGEGCLDDYFKPLDIKEKQKEQKLYYQDCVITKQKGRKNNLRIYALRIDFDTYLITGGAIKWTQKMQEHADTNEELIKLKKAVDYLTENGVFDKESLIDLQNENEY